MASQDRVLHPHLDHTDDRVGPNIHLGGGRAACRALQTLVAEAQVLPALLHGFLEEMGIDLFGFVHSFQTDVLPSYQKTLSA
jgi:hypothetical protein